MASESGTRANPARSKLEKEATDRLADARAEKSRAMPAIREAYFFAAPERSRDLQSSSPTSKTLPDNDDIDLQISIGIEQSEDFATTIINAFMPPEADWADLTPATAVPDIYRDEIMERASEAKSTVFGVIRDSNFYAELAGVLNPDCAVGLFGLMIEAPKMHEPVRVLAVPLKEIDGTIGPDGSIDNRWVTRHTRARYVRSVVGHDVPIPQDIAKKLDEKPARTTAVSWGFWRLWDRDDVAWQKVILVDDRIVFDEILVGDGSCPFIPVRFNPLPESLIGSGPLIKAAPELRVLDEMTAGMVDNLDLSLRPPMTYPNDSFVNVEMGVEPNGWYPIRPGTENAIKKMYEPNKLDAAYFDFTMREKRVKRMFYNDFPEQRGDTPPTATQWLDEMAMAQRRIGTPGEKFWAEGPAEVFKRFMWIAAKRGLIQPIVSAGKTVSLAPQNPTRRAKDQQEVAAAVRGFSIGAQFFPEEMKVSFDGAATLVNIMKKLGGEKVAVRRSPDQIQAATSMLAQVAAGGMPDGGAPGGGA